MAAEKVRTLILNRLCIKEVKGRLLSSTRNSNCFGSIRILFCVRTSKYLKGKQRVPFSPFIKRMEISLNGVNGPFVL